MASGSAVCASAVPSARMTPRAPIQKLLRSIQPARARGDDAAIEARSAIRSLEEGRQLDRRAPFISAARSRLFLKTDRAGQGSILAQSIASPPPCRLERRLNKSSRAMRDRLFLEESTVKG